MWQNGWSTWTWKVHRQTTNSSKPRGQNKRRKRKRGRERERQQFPTFTPLGRAVGCQLDEWENNLGGARATQSETSRQTRIEYFFPSPRSLTRINLTALSYLKRTIENIPSIRSKRKAGEKHSKMESITEAVEVDAIWFESLHAIWQFFPHIHHAQVYSCNWAQVNFRGYSFQIRYYFRPMAD